MEQLSRRDPHYPFDEDPPLAAPTGDEDSDDDEDDEDQGRRRGDGYEWNFSQQDMPFLRRRIIYEIGTKTLMD